MSLTINTATLSGKLMFLVIVVATCVSKVKGCSCPSCNYADAAQRCQCCVYRQIGKRADTTFNLDISLPSHGDPSSGPISDRLSYRFSSVTPNDASDWWARRSYGNPKQNQGVDDGAMLLNGDEFRRRVMNKYRRTQPRMSSMFLRGSPSHSNLGPSLYSPESEY